MMKTYRIIRFKKIHLKPLFILTRIEIQTKINAPVERCFALSTSIDLHKISASRSKEQAIAGVTSGMILLNDTVTWRANHFGIWLKLKVQITEYHSPDYFVDEMIKGAFKSMKHKHEFKPKGDHTIMIDYFDFESRFWLLGRLVDWVILKRYMRHFIIERNQVIKKYAETDRWQTVLGIQ